MTKKPNWQVALALLVPLAGLAAGIIRNERALAGASEWRIPVAGYDPRDPLHGHYVHFRYLWQVEGDARLCEAGQCLICLRQDGEQVIARIVPRDRPGSCVQRVDPLASNISNDFASRIFVSETSAPQLEAALRNGPVDIIALLGPDGRLINRRLEPKP